MIAQPRPTKSLLRSMSQGDTARRRVRLCTLNNLRWMAIGGQTSALIVAQSFLSLHLPSVFLCFAPIAASALLNLVLAVIYPSTRRLSPREATLFLAYDVVQLAALLYLTGGIQNPFAILFLAPVVVAAGTLDVTSTLILCALSFAAVGGLANFHLPLPWAEGTVFVLPPLYRTGIWISLVLGIGFTSIYAWTIAQEGSRMQAGLAATQLALARERRMASLGALAAAAAHELGTPLGTIALVARELEREGQHSAQADDFRLLRGEAERCRAILTRLATPEESVLGQTERIPLGALLDDIASPHRGVDVAISIEMPEGPAPKIWRAPEILHGLGNLIENAADFATAQVVLRAKWNSESLSVEVIDDGPGFAVEIIEQIGEPYITSRPRTANTGDESERQEGMGLGYFIAKTLIEHTGGTLQARNRNRGGAVVTAIWPRGAIDGDAPPRQEL